MKSVILVTIAIFAAITISAQNRELSFKEAVEIGLSENVVMKNTRNSLRSFETDKTFRMMAFTPNLGITGGLSQTTGPQFDNEQGQINSTTTNFRTSLGSNLVLYNGNNRIHSLKSSAYRLEGQELLVKRTEQDIINQVALQFLQVLLDQELLTISEQNLVTQQQTLAEIEGFVISGSRPEVDRYRQEADVKRFELLVIQAKNNLTNDKASLTQTLQLDPANGFVVIRPDWDIDLIRVLEYNLADLHATAMASRADYQRLESVENATMHDFKGAFNGYMPFLSAFASFGSTYFDANDPTNPADPFSTQMSDRRSTSYGLNLTIPVWDRLQTRNTRVFNKVNYENAQNNVEFLEKTVKIEVQNAYNNFTDVKAGYAVSLAQHEAAKLAYETQQESYFVGLASQVELAIANEAYIGAQANLAQTGYRLLFQKILLDYATGVLTQEGIE